MIRLLGNVTIMVESTGILFVVLNCIFRVIFWSSSLVSCVMESIMTSAASEFLMNKSSLFIFTKQKELESMEGFTEESPSGLSGFGITEATQKLLVGLKERGFLMQPRVKVIDIPLTNGSPKGSSEMSQTKGILPSRLSHQIDPAAFIFPSQMKSFSSSNSSSVGRPIAK